MTDNTLIRLAEKLNGESVLITGATGALGRQLVDALIAGGNRVRILARTAGGFPQAWVDHPIDVVLGDICEPLSMEAACMDVDVVLHLASYHPAATDRNPEEHPDHWRVTVEGTRQLIAALRAGRCRRLVFASTTRVLDADPSLYGKSKQQAEQDLLGSDLDVVLLRFPALYGPGVPGNVTALARLYQRGWFPLLPDMGDQRSLIHVADAIQAMLLAAISPASGQQAYQVSDEEIYSLHRISIALAGSAKRWTIPSWVLSGVASLFTAAENLTGLSLPLNTRMLQRLRQGDASPSAAFSLDFGYKPLHRLGF